MTAPTPVTGDTYQGTATGTAVSYYWAGKYYPQIAVSNESATDIIFARADGGTASASSGSGDSTEIGPGQRVTLTNALPEWFQGEPGNPGTLVSVVSAATSTAFNIQGV